MKPDIGLQDKDKALRSSANLRITVRRKDGRRHKDAHGSTGHWDTLSQGWVDGYIAFKSCLKNVNVVLEKWFSQ